MAVFSLGLMKNGSHRGTFNVGGTETRFRLRSDRQGHTAVCPESTAGIDPGVNRSVERAGSTQLNRRMMHQ